MSISQLRGLGRVVKKDDRDFAYLLNTKLKGASVSRWWRNKGWHGDQGSNPTCVGYAWAHWLHAAPIQQKLTPEGIYNFAKFIDEWHGENYEGTSVRGGAKVLYRLGVLTKYRWTWDAVVLRNYILSKGPIVIGVNWHKNMSDIKSDGMMRATGPNHGGHAVCVVGYNGLDETFRIKNSWGNSWGQNGYGNLPIGDMQLLLENDGEACVGVERKAAVR